MELTVLDFHTRKEYALTDISELSMRIPLKRVQHKNAGPETMLNNFTKSINWNDISNIDYTTRATNKHPLKALSERFCDNIILYYLVPVNENTNKLEFLSKFLAEYTAKIKRLFVAHNINITKRNIKPTYSNKEDNKFKQYIKVALPTIPVNDVFALVTNEEGLPLTRKVSI